MKVLGNVRNLIFRRNKALLVLIYLRKIAKQGIILFLQKTFIGKNMWNV